LAGKFKQGGPNGKPLQNLDWVSHNSNWVVTENFFGWAFKTTKHCHGTKLHRQDRKKNKIDDII
jgi:hypothetical protein